VELAQPLAELSVAAGRTAPAAASAAPAAPSSRGARRSWSIRSGQPASNEVSERSPRPTEGNQKDERGRRWRDLIAGFFPAPAATERACARDPEMVPPLSRARNPFVIQNGGRGTKWPEVAWHGWLTKLPMYVPRHEQKKLSLTLPFEMRAWLGSAKEGEDWDSLQAVDALSRAVALPCLRYSRLRSTNPGTHTLLLLLLLPLLLRTRRSRKRRRRRRRRREREGERQGGERKECAYFRERL
jgi:hypothetical protein